MLGFSARSPCRSSVDESESRGPSRDKSRRTIVSISASCILLAEPVTQDTCRNKAQGQLETGAQSRPNRLALARALRHPPLTSYPSRSSLQRRYEADRPNLRVDRAKGELSRNLGDDD